MPLEYVKTTNQADNPLPPSFKSDTENKGKGNISKIQLRTIGRYSCSIHYHINTVFIILIHIR